MTKPSNEQGDAASSLQLPEGWEVRDLSHALAGTGQKPPWIIENLLLAKSATQVSAHPHSMKSLAWLAAALEAPAKHTVWDHFDASRVNRTLFIETEDPLFLIEDRLRGLAKGLGLKRFEDVPGFSYIRTGPFNLVKEAKTLAQIFQHYKPDFAVLSTLQNLLNGRDWKDQSEMDAVNAIIVQLASKYCPIVEITHSPWDKRQRRAAGTITQVANFLTTLHFEKKQFKEDTFVRVTVDSKIGSDVTNFSLRLETEGKEVRRLVYEAPGWPKGAKKDEVITILEEDPAADNAQVAARAGVGVRYVQTIRKEQASEQVL